MRESLDCSIKKPPLVRSTRTVTGKRTLGLWSMVFDCGLQEQARLVRKKSIKVVSCNSANFVQALVTAHDEKLLAVEGMELRDVKGGSVSWMRLSAKVDELGELRTYCSINTPHTTPTSKSLQSGSENQRELPPDVAHSGILANAEIVKVSMGRRASGTPVTNSVCM